MIKEDEKRIRKEVFGNSKDKLTNVLLELTDKQDIKTVAQSRIYFTAIGMCYHCRKKIPLDNMASNEEGTEMQMTCQRCFSITIDATTQTKSFIDKLNKIIKPYGHTMVDGYPNVFDVMYER